MEHTGPLTRQAANRLVHYIIEKNLSVGNKLPNEFELAHTFGISRSTLREAVKALVSRNILEVRQGSGTFVTGPRLGVSEDPLGFTFIKNKQKLAMDLLDMRMAIEPRIAGLAALHATEEEIERMRTLQLEVEQLIHAGKDHMQKDIELHTTIAESSRNLVVPTLIPIIQNAVALFVNITNRELGLETIETHRSIVDAIAAHDAIAASDAMVMHIIYNRHNFTKQFSKIGQNTSEEK